MPLFLVGQNGVDLVFDDIVWNRAGRSQFLQLSEEPVKLFEFTPLKDVEMTGISAECNVDHHHFRLNVTRSSADVVVVEIRRSNTKVIVEDEPDFGRLSSLCSQVTFQDL